MNPVRSLIESSQLLNTEDESRLRLPKHRFLNIFRRTSNGVSPIARSQRVFFFLILTGIFLFAGLSYGFYHLWADFGGGIMAADGGNCACADLAVIYKKPTPHFLIFIGIFSAVFLAGLVRFLWVLIKTRLFLRRVLSLKIPLREPLATLARTLGIPGRIILVAKSPSKVFCFGLLRPKICVSQEVFETLNDEELATVLLHERHHLLRHDPLRSLIVNFFSGMFWFVPGMRQAAVEFGFISECGADDAALLNGGSRDSLKEAILKIGKISKGELISGGQPTGVMFFASSEVRCGAAIKESPESKATYVSRFHNRKTTIKLLTGFAFRENRLERLGGVGMIGESRLSWRRLLWGSGLTISVIFFSLNFLPPRQTTTVNECVKITASCEKTSPLRYSAD